MFESKQVHSACYQISHWIVDKQKDCNIAVEYGKGIVEVMSGKSSDIVAKNQV
jgi:hypothetical protein